MAPVRFIAGRFYQYGRHCFRWNKAEETPQELGRRGERLAAAFLRHQGYKVLYRNFRAPRGGEVDIVCRDRSCDTLVFVEVKTRRSMRFGTPAEAVTSGKQELIARGALAWLRLLHRPEVTFRFDIVEIVVEPHEVRYNLIRDAFRLPARFAV